MVRSVSGDELATSRKEVAGGMTECIFIVLTAGSMTSRDLTCVDSDT